LTVKSNISLDDFGPEQGVVASATSVASATGVRVSDILARGVPLRWDEAVALLQEIVETVIADGGDNAQIPAFEHVLIDGAGTVAVQGARRGERGPVAAGRALHTLLATADVPVPLRLFVSQANAPETHNSLQAFADGLAYFGRPGRDELIRALYERYRSSSAATAGTPNSPVVPPPLPNPTHPDQSPGERRRTPPRWLMPAAVVLGIVSLAAVIWFGMLGGDTSSAESVVAKAKAAIATVTPTLKSALGSASAKPTTAEAPPGEQKKPASTARSRQQATPIDRVARGNVASGSSSTRSFEPLVRPFGLTPAATPPSNESSADAVPLTREYVVAPHEIAETIYSPADVDVQPPVMMYPSLPPPVFFARASDVIVENRMELVIAPDGTVERVRLVNGPTRMPDMMLLSGAKLWRFTPAVKDGVPVRYRTTVSWSGFP
jgi:hypothetical protein